MNNWSQKKLSEICQVNPETRNKNWIFSEIEYIDISSVGTGQFIESPKRLSLKDSPSRAQRIVRNGDIIVSTVRPNRRSFLYLKEAKPETIASTGFAVLRAKEKNDSRFLYYLVTNQEFTDYLVSKAEGSAYPAVNPSVFLNADILLPDYEEQKAIAKILSSLDDKIELNRQMNTTLEAMARAIFKAWFVDFEPVRANIENRPSESASLEIAKLFPSEFENDIPKGWTNGTLKDCCLKVESGGTPSRKVEKYWTNGTIAWLSSGEVRKPIVLDTKEYISIAGYENSNAKLWKKGTTVVAMYGATAGEVCLLANEMTANQACCGLIPKEGFRSFLFTKTFQSKQELASKSSGSAQQNLNQSIVANFQVLLPSENCVKAFEQVTGNLFDKWIENEKENRKLAEIRDSILPRLLSGKLSVENINSYTNK
jgi:type I restriction enzyme, S subunit